MYVVEHPTVFSESKDANFNNSSKSHKNKEKYELTQNEKNENENSRQHKNQEISRNITKRHIIRIRPVHFSRNADAHD
uniref:Uncharacterized protein n=1 Tax=Romanomermis culicivorax TaxID=13658 RepID=A0A915HGB6_ROMCU